MKKTTIYILSSFLSALVSCASGTSSLSNISASSSETSGGFLSSNDSQSTSSIEEISVSSQSVSSDSSTSSSEEMTGRKIIQKLQSMTEIAVKGTYHYNMSFMGSTIDEYYETEGLITEDIYYISSTMTNGDEYDNLYYNYYPDENGMICTDYLLRDNTLSTLVSETTKFTDYASNPFLGLSLRNAKWNREEKTLTISVASVDDYMASFCYLTTYSSSDVIYPPDTFVLYFDDAYEPTTIYGYGADSQYGSSATYQGNFVEKDEITIRSAKPYDEEEGQERIESILNTLQNATSYTAEITSTLFDSGMEDTYVLNVVNGSGVVITDPNGNISGTYAVDSAHYVDFEGVDGDSVLSINASPIDGKAVNAYFSKTYFGDITPDFKYAKELFTTNEDGSFTLKDSYNEVMYLIPDSSLATITGRSSGYIYPLSSYADKGSVKFASDNSEIIISYTSYSEYYQHKIVIKDVNITTYPYTNYICTSE